ncbi:MAG: hypothetical protein AMXMBFR4_26100 [Candidatus Hydrogenedentota bacterium]
MRKQRLHNFAAFLTMGAYLALMALYFNYVSSQTPTDDSMILVRSAEIFHETGKISFNRSSLVEANSSFLYVPIVALGFSLVPRLDIHWYLVAINLLFAYLTLVVFYRFCRRDMPPGWAVAACALVTICPATAFWTASGTEATLVALLELYLIAAATFSHWNNRRTPLALAAASALLVLTRIDGFVVTLSVAVFLLCKRRWRDAAVTAKTTLILFAVMTAWRLHYYGQLLPNTVYAKVTGSLGDRLESAWHFWKLLFVPSGFWIVILPLATLLVLECVAVIRRLRARSDDLLAPVTLVPWLMAAMIAYWFVHGGDIYRERHLILFFPLGIYAWVSMIQTLAADHKPSLALLPVLLVALLMPLTTFPHYYDFRGTHLPAHHVLERDTRIADTLRNNHPNLRTGAVDKLGFISFVLGPEYEIYDPMGLADSHIARQAPKRSRDGGFLLGHAKFDIDYVIGKKPDFVYMLVYSYPTLQHPFIPGFDRHRLENAGYRLSYISSSQTYECLDVRHKTNEELDRLFQSNEYNVAVYLRTPQ